MIATIEELKKTIEDYSGGLAGISERELTIKTSPVKWSKKEILGHLLDSAQTNIRRFVASQYENIPKITYQQDKWVSICDYQNYPTIDLIELWVLLNRHICHILSHTNIQTAKRECDTNDQLNHSIEWLAADYNKHLLHHLHQVMDLTPVPYP